MSRASQILDFNFTAGQVRKAAQKACAGMTRNHKLNRDVYQFTDGSEIVVAGHKVYLNELPLTPAQMKGLKR